MKPLSLEVKFKVTKKLEKFITKRVIGKVSSSSCLALLDYVLLTFPTTVVTQDATASLTSVSEVRHRARSIRFLTLGRTTRSFR